MYYDGANGYLFPYNHTAVTPGNVIIPSGGLSIGTSTSTTGAFKLLINGAVQGGSFVATGGLNTLTATAGAYMYYSGGPYIIGLNSSLARTSMTLDAAGNTINLLGTAAIKDGTQLVNSVFTCTNATTGAGAWSDKTTIAYVAKTASYTALTTDAIINFTANNDTLTLPTAVGVAGKTYTITNSGSGWVKTFTTSSQTFTNLNGTPISTAMGSVGTETIASNGANWIVTIKPITQGTATLSGGTITVTTPAALTNSVILLTDATTGALTNVGTATVGTVTNGVSFVINSSNILDASNINYTITP